VAVPGRVFPPPDDYETVRARFCHVVIHNIHAWLRHHEVAERPAEIEPSPDFKMPVVASAKAMRLLNELVNWLERKRTGTVEIVLLGEPGDGKYRVGSNLPVTVTDREDCVLQAFLKSPTLDQAGLIKESGIGKEAPRVLKSLTTRYGGIFKPAVRLPGGKRGAGGYAAIVVTE
jgi:hypothetical protein